MSFTGPLSTVAVVPTGGGTPPPAMDLWVRFEVWNETSHVFDPLPAGVPIDLMDDDTASNDLIDTQNTDANGQVHFTPTIAQVKSKSGEDKPDLFFLARPAGQTVAGHTMPAKWSTKGWKDKSGQPGYYPKFSGTTLGSAAAPLVFRIGVDFHARFDYLNAGSGTIGTTAPKGVPVQIGTGSPSKDPKMKFRTDAKGEVHGVLFDVDAGEDVFYHMDFEIADAAINLPRALVWMDQGGWMTCWDDADKKFYPKNDQTSLGTQSAPDVFKCTIKDRNVALYMLKTLRELSTFLFHLTGGMWKGVENLTYFRHTIGGTSYSWPVGEVNIEPTDFWNRETLIHETSHQLMWKEASISSKSIAYEYMLGKGKKIHYENLMFTPLQALTEGWAEIMGAIFSTMGTPPYSVSTVKDDDNNTFPLGPAPSVPANRGESVEGAFANGLWAVFQKHVVAAVSTNAHVVESADGDVVAVNSWLTNPAVKDRFLSMIWNPLGDLSSINRATTTDFLGKIKARNPGQWHAMLPELHQFNMAMTPPTVTAITPASGLPAGGQRVTITGTEFRTGATVTIGGTAANVIAIVGSTSLTADTPAGTAGKADIVVTTAAGAGTLSGGFEYSLPPKITLVMPQSGPGAGGTDVTVTGSNFRSGAQVLFGPQAVSNVKFVSPTQITATTPPMAMPFVSGPVDVTVRNPDGQSETVTNGYNYVP